MTDAVKTWLESNYKNYLKKNPPLDQSVLDHVVDWMMSPEAASYQSRLFRIAVPAAIQLADKWTIELNKKNQKNLALVQDLSGLEVIYKFSNGYSFVKLLTKDSFAREGVEMGHCVGGYDPGDDYSILSLRDQNNNPHCTIEFKHSIKHIAQIKGKANQEVIPKYHAYVAEFLNQFDFDSAYSYDLKNISSIYFGNYIFLNSEMPKELTIKKRLQVEQVNYLHTFDTLTVKGDVTLSKNRRTKKLANTLIIEGDLFIEEFHGLLKLADKLIVKGSIEVTNCENLKLLANTLECESACVVDCENFSQKHKMIESYLDKAAA